MGAFPSPSVEKYGPACFLPGAHAEAMELAEGLDLTVLCDSDANRLARAGQRYGKARLFADARAMLGEGAPDLVSIATRTPGRADLIRDCLGAGARALHVEKPLCNSVSELTALEKAFARDDVFVTLGALRRHFAVYQRALEEARSGAYGDLLAAYGECGARTLYWSHPHTVDLLLFAAGDARIEAVQARLSSLEREGERVLNDPVVLDASVWFEGGFSGHITRMPGTDWRLACETAQIAVVANGASLWRSGRAQAQRDDNPYDEPERLLFCAPDAPEGALTAIHQLAACLRGEADAIAANALVKRDIVRGQKVLFAIVQSHLEGGRPVTLDEVDPAMVIEARTHGVPA